MRGTPIKILKYTTSYPSLMRATKSSDDIVASIDITVNCTHHHLSLSKQEVNALAEMLNEVLEDWQ